MVFRADYLRERKSGENMADLMRAKDILDAIKRNKERLAPEEAKGAMFYGYRRASDHIAELITRTIPTVDAVEVVRCEKCKWWTKQEASLQGRCELGGFYPTGGWYCANGQGETDGDT
jgi:hypothetical protein